MTDNKPEDYRIAPCGNGPLANSWKDKPHRVLFDCADDLKAAHDRIEELERGTPSPQVVVIERTHRPDIDWGGFACQ